MIELRKFVAPEFVYGNGAISLVARYAANFGARKPLLVTDPGVLNAGWGDVVLGELRKEGIDCAIFPDISQNPCDFQVMSGAEFYREKGCDVIIAVGGGSPMDCAKAIGIVCTNHEFVTAFEGVDNVPVPGPPLICIPTTAGTSADVSQFAIINNTEKKTKFAIISKTMVPDVALIDPAATLTMDGYLTACTGMDALVHAIEALVSTAHSPITDIHAMQAIRLIRQALPLAIKNPGDSEVRDLMMLGSLEAGLAFSNASLGAVHALAHSLGGFLDLPHGECNAILLGPVISYNFGSAPERYRIVADCLGLPVKDMNDSALRAALLKDIADLRQCLGITVTLGSRGLRREHLPFLAAHAIVDPCMVTNPRVPTQQDIEEIYAGAV